jgi:hypothetical protein
VDYVDVSLENQILGGNITQYLQFCYDSLTFPDNSTEVGTNTCAAFTRRSDFQVDNGYRTGVHQPRRHRGEGLQHPRRLQLRDRGRPELRRVPHPADLGDLRFRFNAYNLEDFITSASGTFTDAQISTGSITAGRPEWETQLSTIYTRGPLDIGLTWDWFSEQKLFSGGALATAETFPFLNFPGVHLFSTSVGYEFADRYRVQLTVNNLLDTNFYGENGELAGPTIDYVSTFGRTYRVSLRATF